MKFELLADNQDEYIKVAKWYYEEWAKDIPGITLRSVEDKIANSLNRDKAPLIVLAKLEGLVVGAAELKLREMNIYPDYEFWLGGVYVETSCRGKGIGRVMVLHMLELARGIGIETLYLQTEHEQGGIYSECGFRAIESVVYNGNKVLVMVSNA